jgi:hypothetical protein
MVREVFIHDLDQSLSLDDVAEIVYVSESYPRTVSETVVLALRVHQDTVKIESVMFRHQEHNSTTQYHYKARPDYTKTVNLLGDIRDRVVRKRRWDEGRPLQPLAPRMR